MDTICQEIGINAQHVCESSTTTPGRFQLICDKKWLQTLEIQHKIDKFPIAKLDRRSHPTGPLQHPWTRILVQTYRKQPHAKVFPLPKTNVNDTTAITTSITTTTTTTLTENDGTFAETLPLTFSQAMSYVTNVNFRNLWEAAYKRYSAAHVKFCKPSKDATVTAANNKLLNSPGGCACAADLMPHDVVLKELIQRVFHCPVIHCKLDRLRGSLSESNDNGSLNGDASNSECHANILPAIIAIETSTHFCVLFYPPAVATSLYDCITYSPAIIGHSYNKPLFLIYQILQLSKALQSQGLFLGDVRLHDILVRDNLWVQIVPRLEANMLQQSLDDALQQLATSPSECVAEADMSTGIDVDATHHLHGVNVNAAAAAATAATAGGVSVEDDDDDDIAGGCGEYSASTKFDLKFAYDLDQFSLREYCEMWCCGQLSNYDYLTILNNAAGRSLNNPAYYHIMPWVTDFTARNGVNWRDLTRSKYRLNKGDVHLDLMFNHAAHHGGKEVPHHVTDFLSEITYFVYMARRTPQHILREHVRPIWVPAEYPVSIQRLQEWTPDECIPEFYSDPMIFKSIHEDLADLELPTWATCPEDFIAKHREALESQYVSERLQYWIDLNFGYKLTGKAAVKSKNVCLSLVDQHKTLCQRGIVQLFTLPHPAKRFPSPWFSRTPPRLQQLASSNSPQHHSRRQHKLSTSSGDNNNSNSKRLARSTENLYSATDTSSSTASSTTGINNSPRLSMQRSAFGNDELVSNANFYPTTNFIELPKNYNPCALLQSLESMQNFFARTFPKQHPTASAHEKMVNSDLMFDENSEEHSFTNQLFANETNADNPKATTTSTTFNATAIKQKTTKNMLAPCTGYIKKRTLKNLLTEKRERDLQVIGCLIVEIFAIQRLRPLLMNGFNANYEERFQACKTVAEIYRNELPKCLRYIVNILLEFTPQELVSDKGLPPPTATQLLEPIFSNLLIPFPNNYYATYALIRTLHTFDFNSILLELHTHFNCDGKNCAKYTEIDRTRVLFERKIAECKVMSCCAHIGRLLEPLAYEQFSPVELLLPHIIDLLTAEQTSILAAWNLFDPVAQALGINNTQKYLLQPIMKLYDVESFERGMISVRTRPVDTTNTNGGGQLRFSMSSSFKSRKSVKLYHHSFLLRLIVRFGLRCFLLNFIAPLIEAVGGYKEPEDSNGFHYHSTTVNESTNRRMSKSLADEDMSSVTLMSPEMLETEAEDATLSLDVPATLHKQDIEDVFSFDDDANSDYVSNSGTAENKSIDSFDLRPTTAEEAKEDIYNHRTTLNATPERLAISEIFYGSKMSNNSLDESDKISLQSQTVNDSPTSATSGAEPGAATGSADPDVVISDSVDHLGPKSPTIEIPGGIYRRRFQLSAIDCDIGSRKSVDSFEILTEAVAEEQQKRQENLNVDSTKISNEIHINNEEESLDSLQASVISKMSEAKAEQNNRISEMSAESLVWLSHRLGPVLTSRYITRNLLKMLTLCYVGQENLLPETQNNQDEESNLNYFTIADARVVGDRSAVRVLECLISIAALFGEEIILLQYFPHISELISLSTKRLTSSLEGAIISSLQLLKYIVPCLTDATIMEHLKDVLLDAIILPIIRLLGSARLLMPSSYLGRSVLARKLLDAVYALCVRIGPDMSKEHICMPVLRPFFLIFDKAYGLSYNLKPKIDELSTISPLFTDFADNLKQTHQHQRELEEIRDVFGPALAHTAYLSFLRFLGEAIMQRTLLNMEFILTLCHEYEQPAAFKPLNTEHSDNYVSTDAVDCPTGGAAQTESCAANSFGTNVIGNRLEVTTKRETTTSIKCDVDSMEVLDMVAYKFEQIPITRHLKGNWLAYWRHEISRGDKDTSLNLKHIKLQSFVGHTNSVRAIVALDNENSFISASKDKTVKLWSLRSEGDGRKTSNCQFTYTAHKKSIHSLAFLDAMRYVVSCDCGVHIWDPFIGRPLGILDTNKHSSITVVKSLPSPSPLVLAGTAEASVKIIDTRCMQYVNEWRVSAAPQNSSSTVRCLTVAPSGNWLAVGLSSGSIVMLDTRTGIVLNAWRPMECDLLQLAAPNDQKLISSALDHSLAVWHANDGTLHYQMKPPPEPAHFLQAIGNELVYATTGNRIGIYSDISSSHAAHSITKLRSETFRGVLTSLAVMPINHAFLAGNESGNIVLLC